MTEITLHQADAFTDRPFSGNPAAVVVTEAPLDAALMQAIAAEMNLSETAFVTPAAAEDHGGDAAGSDGGIWAIRWFTPTLEVPFCGHATLAATHVMAAELGLGSRFRFVTARVGTLAAAQTGPGRYALDLPRLEPEPLDHVPAAIAGLFGTPPRAAFGTFENLFVELGDAGAVRGFRADPAAILAATAAAGLPTAGLGITAEGGRTPAGEPVDFTSRYFAPAHGIAEDPVTGSAHATLAPWWAGRLGRGDLRAHQASARGGLIGCRVTGTRVELTGDAVTVLAARLRLPG
ncbi:MAG: PhzF family phenazine biosynthesis protein [Defluviimonas sp.]|uniref:PhzF family phenazine biosynthesis protein n=1 Tax=Albidovulum sp. TaxID=1872424 RepID=UPI001DC6B3ED|nr:PhzF family phenazine biosynthesis protein [Paracoccaceae bacterium]MCC0064165.1 PhzF family phenazine biosynthesis protein [Defluviimonas sp.]